MTSILVRDTEGRFDIDVKRRRQSENEAEIRVRQPQAKECLEPPEPGRGKG